MAGGPNIGTGGRRGAAVQTVRVLNLLTDLGLQPADLLRGLCLDRSRKRQAAKHAEPANKDKTSESKKENVELKLSQRT